MPEGVGLINGWRTTVAVAASVTSNASRVVTILSTGTGGAQSGAFGFAVSAATAVSVSAQVQGGFGTATSNMLMSGATASLAGNGGTFFTNPPLPQYFNVVVTISHTAANQTVSLTCGAWGPNL